TLTLKRNAHYAQKGTPDNASPYPATEVRLADAIAAPAASVPAAKPIPAAKPVPAVKPIPAVKPKPAAAKPAARPKRQSRTPDFVLRGAPKEPLKEMPLPDRARLLD